MLPNTHTGWCHDHLRNAPTHTLAKHPILEIETNKHIQTSQKMYMKMVDEKKYERHPGFAIIAGCMVIIPHYHSITKVEGTRGDTNMHRLTPTRSKHTHTHTHSKNQGKTNERTLAWTAVNT